MSSGISLDGQSLMLPPSVVYQTPGGGGSVTTATTGGGGPGGLGEAPSPTHSDLYSYTLSPSHQTRDGHDRNGGETDDDEDEYDDDRGARIMMGMSHPPGMIVGGGGADEEAPPGLAEGESGEEMASSSASALFDGRSLQISASRSADDDDDVSSMNSQSLCQGMGFSPSPAAAGAAASGAAADTPASLVSLSSLPQTPRDSGVDVEEANRYLGPYGQSTKLKIVGSASLTNDDALEGGSASRKGASSRGRSNDAEDGGILEHGKSSEQRQGGCCRCCVPAWIRGAPRWLKVVLAASAVLAVLAVAVVAAAVGLALSDRAGGSSANGSVGANNSSSLGGAPSTPSFPVNTTLAPAPAPAVNETDGGGGSSGPDPLPSANNTNSSHGAGSNNGTNGGWSDLVRMSFAATAGRYPDELAQQVPELLPNFTSTKTVTAAVDGGPVTAQQADDNGGGNAPPGGGDVESVLQFLAHLGDWNSPSYTNCDESAYEDIADLFTASTVPVYFVPGDNEYNGA
jgi:hypothetical protein